MEQFNPGLRNLVNLGKNYEKSVAGELFFFPLCFCYYIKKKIQSLYIKLELAKKWKMANWKDKLAILEEGSDRLDNNVAICYSVVFRGY